MSLSNYHWIDGKIIDIIQRDKSQNIYTVVLSKKMKNPKKGVEPKQVDALIPIIFWGYMGEHCKNNLVIGMSVTVQFYIWSKEVKPYFNISLVARECLEGMNMKPKNEFLQKQKEQQKQDIVERTKPQHEIEPQSNNDFSGNILFDDVKLKPVKKDETIDPFN